jgi:hypothetical protein
MLIGYEYRIESGVAGNIFTHIRGVQMMMSLYQAGNIAVVAQMQCALFRQDLLGCFVLNTTRLISHKMYEGWKDPRHTDAQFCCATPNGFSGMIGDWPIKFAIILQDLAMLCKAVDERAITGDTPFVDDTQANLESRLVDLLNTSRISLSSADPIYEACTYVAYLCTYKLSVGIWKGSFIPEICVDRILSRLAAAAPDPRLAASRSLLLWLFLVGGLTERSRIGQRVKTLINSVFFMQLQMLHKEWGNFKTCMMAFIWSKHAIERRVFPLWQELHLDITPELL